MMGNGLGFGFGIPGLGMVLVWVLIIVAVVLLVRVFAGGLPRGGKSARQLLDERFARGEIDQQEYEEKRRLLG
ncbi:MAG: SHOCT domain-containing protein [Bdellovibrio bacteriovorus]